MASNTLILKDGRHEWVDNDQHFQDLIREYMGDHAAEWYEDRIKNGVGDIHQLISTYIPNVSSLQSINESLDNMDMDDWHELFWSLYEIRGWRE